MRKKAYMKFVLKRERERFKEWRTVLNTIIRDNTELNRIIKVVPFENILSDSYKQLELIKKYG